ncbi:MAG: metallopeptidase family protein [Anaerostipes sp.]|nr:metallopeptidase family protein [Anaerostipes sp.]
MELERFYEILNQLADELPEELCEGLSGGIILKEECKESPHAKQHDLFIRGEYIRSNLGCQIVIYYGSFMHLHGYMEEENLIKEMRKVLRHELRHHVEYRSGWRDLEEEDKQFLEKYLK